MTNQIKLLFFQHKQRGQPYSDTSPYKVSVYSLSMTTCLTSLHLTKCSFNISKEVSRTETLPHTSKCVFFIDDHLFAFNQMFFQHMQSSWTKRLVQWDFFPLQRKRVLSCFSLWLSCFSLWLSCFSLSLSCFSLSLSCFSLSLSFSLVLLSFSDFSNQKRETDSSSFDQLCHLPLKLDLVTFENV